MGFLRNRLGRITNACQQFVVYGFEAGAGKKKNVDMFSGDLVQLDQIADSRRTRGDNDVVALEVFVGADVFPGHIQSVNVVPACFCRIVPQYFQHGSRRIQRRNPCYFVRCRNAEAPRPGTDVQQGVVRMQLHGLDLQLGVGAFEFGEGIVSDGECIPQSGIVKSGRHQHIAKQFPVDQAVHCISPFCPAGCKNASISASVRS